MTEQKPSDTERLITDKTNSETTNSYLDVLLHKQIKTSRNEVFNGVLIGWINGFDESGSPLILIPGFIDAPIAARSLCTVQTKNLNQQCALMFESGDLNKPLIMGLLQQTVLSLKSDSIQTDDALLDKPTVAKSFIATEEILFQCGDASLRLLKDGQIELRGSLISSHSTGLNHIRGASVKLN